jgi:hypothetical protein
MIQTYDKEYVEALIAVYEAADKYFVATMTGQPRPRSRQALSDALDELNVYRAKDEAERR